MEEKREQRGKGSREARRRGRVAPAAVPEPHKSDKVNRRQVQRSARVARQRLDQHHPFKIVYEDEDLVVVNKRGGLLAVPVAGSRVANLWYLLNSERREWGERVLVVHRIDRYTSGLIVFAKNKLVRANLIEQFRKHRPRREYLVLVRGSLVKKTGKLTHYLKLTRDGFRQRVVKDRSQGTKAVLDYQVIDSSRGLSLLKVRLDTGLKNQIRVQFLAAGYPVVGDRHYVGAELNEGGIDRQALHASLLTLKHPRTGEILTFESALPADFKVLLRRYGIKGELPRE